MGMNLKFFFLLPIALVFFPYINESAENLSNTVKLATHNQAPYGSYKSDGSFDGLTYKLMKCVFQKMDIPVKIDILPWKRAQTEVENSHYDGFFPAIKTDERTAFSAASAQIADQKWVWYLLKSSKLDPLSSNFKTKATVGAHLGSKRLEYLENNNYKVVLRNSDEDGLFKDALGL